MDRLSRKVPPQVGLNTGRSCTRLLWQPWIGYSSRFSDVFGVFRIRWMNGVDPTKHCQLLDFQQENQAASGATMLATPVDGTVIGLMLWLIRVDPPANLCLFSTFLDFL